MAEYALLGCLVLSTSRQKLLSLLSRNNVFPDFLQFQSDFYALKYPEFAKREFLELVFKLFP